MDGLGPLWLRPRLLLEELLALRELLEDELWELFEEKFDELASKLAIDQGISFSVVEQARREKKENQRNLRQNGMMGSQLDQQIQSNNVLDQVKLGIDFTKLAKLA